MKPDTHLFWQVLLVLSVVLLAQWAATQWIASMLGYSPRLGPGVFEVLGVRIYAPWAFFAWWYSYEAYAPEIFDRGGLIAGSGGVAAIFIAVIGSILRARWAKQVTTYGSARWALPSDMRKAGLLGSSGVFLGQTTNAYLRHSGPEHVIAFAPTRSGKGVGLVVPTLLSWPDSTVVHDIKGENWQLTSGWRSTFSHCVRFDPTDREGACYNPLLEVRKGHGDVRDVQNIADILVDPEGVLKRDHWDMTAHALLTGTILHILYAEEEKTIGKIVDILTQPGRSIDDTLAMMLQTNHLGTDAAPIVHPGVQKYIQEVKGTTDRERSGIVSTTLTFLSLYFDPIVAKLTSKSDWCIDDLISEDRPLSLYLCVPPSDITRTKPLMRLILNQIGRRLTETCEPAKGRLERREILLMLDEFPALGRLDFFESTMAFMAGYGVRAYLVTQSLNQIEKAYGPNNSILDNCHVRIAFAANDERTARRISDALGTKTEQRAVKNYAGHRLAPWLSHKMVSRQETSRQLLTPGEVMQLPSTEELVLVSGAPPVRAKKLRYYEDANFTGRIIDPPLAGSALPPPPGDDWGGLRRYIHEDLIVSDGFRSEDQYLRRPSKPPRTIDAPLIGRGGNETKPRHPALKDGLFEVAKNADGMEQAGGLDLGGERS